MSQLPSLGEFEREGRNRSPLSKHQWNIYQAAERWLASVRDGLEKNRDIELKNPIPAATGGIICDVMYVNNISPIAYIFQDNLHPGCGVINQRYDDETQGNLYTVSFPPDLVKNSEQYENAPLHTELSFGPENFLVRFLNEPKSIMTALLVTCFSASVTTNHSLWKNLGVWVYDYAGPILAGLFK